VFDEWKDAEVVLTHKKGDFKLYDIWRGISLLDAVGKILARIIQECLQSIAENVLPESQCGFSKGRGCADMIFAASQIMEKTREHGVYAQV
jgi:hypothetical protein